MHVALVLRTVDNPTDPITTPHARVAEIAGFCRYRFWHLLFIHCVVAVLYLFRGIIPFSRHHNLCRYHNLWRYHNLCRYDDFLAVSYLFGGTIIACVGVIPFWQYHNLCRYHTVLAAS